MKNLNNATIIGNLTRDPIIFSSGEQKVTKVTVAVNRGKGKDGEEIGADFIPIVAFGRLGEVLAEYTKKGAKIAVSGSLLSGSWEKDGETRYSVEVNARHIEFLDLKVSVIGEDEKPPV